jgi:long-chain acyl-CoA synthetase
MKVYKLETHTMRELVIKGSRHYNARTALGWVKGRSFSYKEMGDYSFAVSERLKKAGLSKGDKIAILSENRPEWGMAYLGITAGGFTAVPILNEFGADQIRNILKHAECKAAFVSEQLSAKALPICEGLTVIPIESILELQIAKSGSLDFPEISEDDLAAIIYTSGTTGNSKGVMLTHKNIIWDAIATRSIIKLKTSDVLLSVLPLAHTYECTIGFIDPLLQGFIDLLYRQTALSHGASPGS